MMGRRNANFENDRKRRISLFGQKANSHMFDQAAKIQRNAAIKVNRNANEEVKEENDQTTSWSEFIIIGYENRSKAIFDVFVLFFVLYSCITSMFNSVFETSENPILVIFDLCVELIFVIDIALNFLHAYKDPDTFKEVRSLKKIGYNYVRNGWFLIDFVSVFPFRYLLPSGNSGEITKLLRLARLPRLSKLIDI